MKIIMLCHSSAGGSGVVASELAMALQQRGHEVHVLAQAIPFRFTKATISSQQQPLRGRTQQLSVAFHQWLAKMRGKTVEQSTKIQFHQSEQIQYPLFGNTGMENSLQTLSTANKLVELVQKHGIELVHAHYAIPHSTSAWLAQQICNNRFAVVTTLHGTDVSLLGQEQALFATTKHGVQQSNVVTAVSHSLAKLAKEVFSRQDIHTIHNWVDTNRFIPIVNSGLRAKYAKASEHLVVHVSNFREVKRPLDAVRVFAGITKTMPAKLLMLGNGPLRQDCEQLAQELGVSAQVHFIDSTPQPEHILGLADVLLLPSELESFGLVALEAMSCGVPVVANDVGGLSEVVLHGQTGLLCALGDTDGMTEAALEVLKNRAIFGMRARAAAKYFSSERALTEYERLYTEARKRVQPAAASSQFLSQLV